MLVRKNEELYKAYKRALLRENNALLFKIIILTIRQLLVQSLFRVLLFQRMPAHLV